jgi:D-amino peptidase
MMQEIDESFDAVLMIGYHSYGSSGDNPLSHTLEDNLSYIKINGEYASEFLINTYIAELVKVPVVFVSGDLGLCEHVKKINSNITTVGLNKGVGDSIISIHPNLAFEKIKQGVEDSLKGKIKNCRIKLPSKFEVEISFINHTKAFKGSFYPGIKQISSTNLLFSTDNYFEVLRMIMFVIHS